jgi:transposase
MTFSTEHNCKISTLPNKVERLEQVKKNLEPENKKLQMKIPWYEEQVRQAMKSNYASKSERFERTQLDLFGRGQRTSKYKTRRTRCEIITYEQKKQIKEKKLDLSDLPVETIEYTIDDAKCPSCDHDMHVMNKEIRRELKVIPAKLTVIEHVSHVVLKAESPNSVIPKNVLSPSLLAHIMNRKCAEVILLYRQEQQFHHLGIAAEPRQESQEHDTK